MTAPSPNGATPAAADQQAEHVYRNYPAYGQQLAAINVLLGNLPLAAMLAACKRHQTTSVLTLPPGATSEQAQAVAAGLRVDERVIGAALNLQRVLQAVANGT